MSAAVSLIEKIRSHLGHGGLGSAPRAKSVGGWIKTHRANRSKVTYWGDAFALWGAVRFEGDTFATWRTGSGRTTVFISDEVAHIFVTTGTPVGRKAAGRVVAYARMDLVEHVTRLWLGKESVKSLTYWCENLFHIIVKGTSIILTPKQDKIVRKMVLAERRSTDSYLDPKPGMGKNPCGDYLHYCLREGPLQSALKSMQVTESMEEVVPPQGLLSLYGISKAENAQQWQGPPPVSSRRRNRTPRAE